MLQEVVTVNETDGSAVFEVTDLLRGFRYFVQEIGSHYELHFPTGDGYVEVVVDREEDLTDVADEYFRNVVATRLG